MAEEIKRIYELEDETDIQNAYVMSDLSGRPSALKTKLSVFSLKASLQLSDSQYFDFNYSGWELLNGNYFFTCLGSEIENSKFTPEATATYLIYVQVHNTTGLHSLEIHYTNDSLLINKIEINTRLATTLAAAITKGWTAYISTPFSYVKAFQTEQSLNSSDISNITDDYLSTGCSVTWEELDASSTLRFDFSFYVEGISPSSAVQFRILENGAEVFEGNAIALGRTTQSLTQFFIVTTHSPVTPTTYEIEFKNVGGQVDLLGSQKQSNMIVTETFQTTIL